MARHGLARLGKPRLGKAWSGAARLGWATQGKEFSNMNSFSAKIIGISPLMTHNERLANPLDLVAKELKQLTSQRGKTEELLEQIMKVEWLGGLYLANSQVVLPADNIIACLKEGAKKRKKGKEFAAGVLPAAAYYPLEYDGPKTPEEMWAAGGFLDYRGVGVSGKRIMRSRPIFRQWAVRVSFSFDADIVQENELLEALEIAGERVGLCERRPAKGGSFGRFVVEV